MRIALYHPTVDKRGKPCPGWRPEPADLSWPELAELLTTHEPTACAPCPGKHCSQKLTIAWSPVDLDEHASIRGNQATRAVTVAVLDLDGRTEAECCALLDRLAGLSLVCHSTHSHTADRPCLRIVLELAAPVPAHEWPRFWALLVDRFAVPADRSCKDPARLYYLPSAPAGSDVFTLIQPGRALDPIELLGAARREPPPITPDTDLEDLPEPQSEDLVALRERLRELRRRKARSTDPLELDRHRILDCLLEARPLALPPEASDDEVEQSGTPKGRSVAVNRTASHLAYWLPAGTSTDAAVEVMRPAILAMQCEPEGAVHWLEVAADSYARSMERRQVEDAERRARDQRIRERLRGLVPRPGREPEPESEGDPSAAEPQGEDEIDWRDLLLRKKGDELRPCGENVYTILTFSEDTRGTLRFNLVTKRIDVHGGPFAGTPSAVLAPEVKGWLLRFWDLAVGTQEVEESILRTAYANAYDPLREYLEGLAWDGRERLPSFLQDYCADPTDPSGEDLTEYLAQVGTRWVISAVARALDPGCKVDTMLILQGLEGAKKTSLFEILGGEWYSSEQLVLGDKDSKLLAANTWITEHAELTSFSKSEEEARTAFLSQRKDLVRPPYGKNHEPFLRRSVNVGTTNKHDILGVHGNRRYHCVTVRAGEIDIDRLRAERDQIWAEGVVRYKRFLAAQQSGVRDRDNPDRWWFNLDEQALVNRQTNKRLREMPSEQRIWEWWVGLKPADRPVYLTAHQVADKALRWPSDRPLTQGMLTEIGVALGRLGWRHSRPTIAGRRTYAYEAPEELRQIGQLGKPAIVRDIAQAKGGK